MAKLGLRWTGCGGDFATAAGQVVAQDPTAEAPGPIALLLRADLLQELQEREHLTLCWAVIGEKRTLSAGFEGSDDPTLRMSGAFILAGPDIKGFMKRMLDEHSADGPRLIDIYRSRDCAVIRPQALPRSRVSTRRTPS